MATALDLEQLDVQLVHPAASSPVRSRPGDAGIDLRCVEPFTLVQGQYAKVRTGIAIALPPGVCGLIVPRSGLAANEGIAPFGGLIDPNFRGEICVTLHHSGVRPFLANAGDRIAQLLLLPFWAPALRLVDTLPPAHDDRGANGWGSSGLA